MSKHLSLAARHVLTTAVATAVLLAPAISLAAPNPDEQSPVDARAVGYDRNLWLNNGTTSLTWLLLIGLVVVGMAVMFKNAKRSHLD